MGTKWDFKKKLKFLVSVSVSITLFFVAVLLVIWSIILTDKTRSTYVRSDVEFSEIINKNYIKGFEDMSQSGEFSFRFREDEINDLLSDGVKAINDKHIENIYYEKGQEKFHIFYVDLKKMPIKTRVVITTYVSEWDTDKLTLKIYTAKMGKVECSKHLERRGYLTEKFLNKYLDACHLPATYNETSKAFIIGAKDYVSMFPKGDFTNLLWNEVLETPDAYLMNPTTLGINVSFSKLRTTSELTKKTSETELPNFYQELKDNLEAVDFSSMSVGESRTAYSISLDDFDHLLTECLPNTKEEVNSTLLSSKATFELVGSNTSINNEGNLDITYLYSLNGYLVDVHQEVEFDDYSTSYFNAEFSITNYITFANKNKGDYKTYFSPIFEEIYKNIQEKVSNFFNYSKTNKTLSIDLETMNNSHSSSSLRDSYKSIFTNSSGKTIDFIVQKSV